MKVQTQNRINPFLLWLFGAGVTLVVIMAALVLRMPNSVPFDSVIDRVRALSEVQEFVIKVGAAKNGRSVVYRVDEVLQNGDTVVVVAEADLEKQTVWKRFHVKRDNEVLGENSLTGELESVQ